MPRYADVDSLMRLIPMEEIVARTAIANAPTADVRENVHAHWIKMSDANGVYWTCSECGEDIPRVLDFDPQFDLFPRLKSIEKTNFCPYCGAQMDERREDEDR